MARKRKGDQVDGWIAVDKPVGLTSTQVVAIVRRAFNAAKAGHGGTLDPLATGILPVALGEATKTVPYVMDGSKTYRWRVRWGEQRSTDDLEGEVVATSDVRPSREQIEAVLPRFTGAIEQVPPAFSAIKVDGERAYDLARAGEAVALKSRVVQIERQTLLDMPDSDHADFETRAGKGTYIRSLARDIALALGTVGSIALLRRTACGPFNEQNAISLDMLREVGHSPPPRTYLLPVETALDDIPALALTEAEARRLQSGQQLSLLRLSARFPQVPFTQDMVLRAMDGRRLVALVRVDGGEIRPVRVMNLKHPDMEKTDVDHR
ncbi:MAG: tRNA pseudouridine(55) synthase TruB [Solirubrobacterales bacterium]